MEKVGKWRQFLYNPKSYTLYNFKGTYMQVAVKKWGNSVGIRIPALLSNSLKLQAESLVDIQEVDGRLIIEPIKPKYNLEQLLSGITEDNLHNEVDFGKPVGKEML
ncbi:antitoxin MazE domain protein [Glaesserella parasuis H465]|nr:antitoxin MazE domain protein [Glaesserella parasuis H465]